MQKRFTDFKLEKESVVKSKLERMKFKNQKQKGIKKLIKLMMEKMIIMIS